MLRLAFHTQAPDPHGPPRQPVRGPPRGPGAPRSLVAAQPRRLLPGQDGIPGGGGRQGCGSAPGAEVRLREEDTPPRPLPQGTVTPSGAGAGSACLPGSIPGAVSLHGGWGRGRGEVLCDVPGGLRCHSPLLAGAGGAGGPAGSLPGATGQETHARGRAPACARAPRLVVPGGGRGCAQVRGELPPGQCSQVGRGAPPDSVSAAHPQACARCSQRRCRPTGCASRVCRWSGAWETVLGSRPLRAPSRVPWSVMPGLLWAPSPVVA